MKINVTEKHIAAGRAGDVSACPITLALREQSSFTHAVVSEDKIFLTSISAVPLPHPARDFVFRFDRSLTVEPFSFELEEQVEPFSFEVEISP